jgi:hypothetical protein
MQETLFNETVGQEEGWISWVNISFDYSSIIFCVEGNIKLKHNITMAHFVPIRLQTWPPQAILVSDWLISKKSSPLKLLSQIN